MSIERILSRKSVSYFLEKSGWRPVDVITHGATSEILILEKGSKRCALKLAREKVKEIVIREHRLLLHLNTTEPELSVPRVGEWLEEINGFQMEYLLSPTPEIKQSEYWPAQLARALRKIHNSKLPEIAEIPDDSPDIAHTVSQRFADHCAFIHRDDYWENLPDEYLPALDLVRKYYEPYIALIPEVEKALSSAQPVITHGDLAGDNIMSRSDRMPVFIDWGEVRISSGLLDLACLLTFVDWDEERIEHFLEEYFHSPTELEKNLPGIQALRRFYRYLTCVSSLWWLMQPEEEKLDTVGRVFLKKVLSKL